MLQHLNVFKIFIISVDIVLKEQLTFQIKIYFIDKSCGRIVCKDCHPQLSVQHCQACRGPCSRSVELNSRSPPDVKNLFSDPSDLIKPIIKTLDFQEKQKRSYLLSQSKRLAALDAKQKEILRQKKERIAAIEKAKLKLAQLHGDIAKKKKQLRNGAPRDQNSVDHPRSQLSLCKQFPNDDQDKDHHPNLFETPKKRQNETYGINDGGFLQLKTPGVFYGKKEVTPRIKDPIKKRSKTSATGNNILERLERLENSFENPLREKIKMRQRKHKYHSFFSPDYDKYCP